MTGKPGLESPPAHRDIISNRMARKWSRSAQLGRILWALATPLFSWSPRSLWAWRRQLLRWFGADIGRDVHIYPSVRITIPWNLAIGDESAVGDGAILYALGPVTIGRQVTISQYAHLCAGTHDHRRPDFPLQKAPITIGDGVWVCADAFIGPDRTVGHRAIVGARAVVVKDVPAGAIVGGNPATVISQRQDS
ncbi:MAG: acetyltransferase [Pseudomonadota bacterium]